MKKQIKLIEKGFPTGTDVLTPSGYIPIENIKIGAEVFCHSVALNHTLTTVVQDTHVYEHEIQKFYKQHLRFLCSWDQAFYGYYNKCVNGGTWIKEYGFIAARDFRRFTYLQLTSPVMNVDIEETREFRDSFVPSQYFHQREYKEKIDRKKYFSELSAKDYEKCAIIAQLAGDKAFYRTAGGTDEQRVYCFFEKEYMRLDLFRVQSQGINFAYNLTTEEGTFIIRQNGFYGITGDNTK
jgi:hypothetical protein